MELVAELFRFTASHNLNPENVFGGNGDVYSQVLQMESAEVLDRWLRRVCTNLQNAVMNERQDSTKFFVKNAEEYVKEHFADQDLGVDEVCRKLNVSEMCIRDSLYADYSLSCLPWTASESYLSGSDHLR